MANLRLRHNDFVKSTMFSQPNVVMRYGYEQMQSVSIQGDGFGPQKNEAKTSSKSSSVLKKEGVFDLAPIDAFPVATDCSCLRSSAHNLSARGRSNSFDRSLAARFYTTQAKDSVSTTTINDSDDENEEALQLPVIMKTLKRFSSRELTPLQAKNISRLAKGYHGKDELSPQYTSLFLDFMDCDSPAIQEATLITLSLMIEKGESNDNLLFTRYPDILDNVLSLASDGPSLEVHLAALLVIEKMTKLEENIAKWERQLEDIVYPLVHAVVKNRESSQSQKMASLAIMRNLAHSSVFAIRIKQDVVSQLTSAFDNSQMKGLYLAVLHETLQRSKQRVSADILDNMLLPVLTSMLSDGPCETQRQSLNLLLYFVEDEASRSSMLSNPSTTAFCILCAKHSQCRKVRSMSTRILEQFFSVKAARQAREFMQCTSDAWTLEGKNKSGPKPLIREERVSSAIRKKSRAEVQLWSDFDKLITELVNMLEKEASIYHDKEKITCELSLIGSVNKDQLTCITSLVGCFNKLCLWPLQRPRTAHSAIGDIPDRLSLDILSMASSINRHHTMDTWHRIGAQLMSLFTQVLKRIPSGIPQSSVNSSSKRPQAWSESDEKQPQNSNSTNEKNHQQKSIANENEQRNSSPSHHNERVNSSKGSKAESHPDPLVLKFLLSIEEFTLLSNLLDFALIMSLATCSFKNTLPADSETQEGEFGQNVAREKSERETKADIVERETLMERKALKNDIVELGVIAKLGQLLSHDDAEIKVLCTASLRMLLLPVNDKLSPGSKHSSYVTRNIVGRSRPQSARGRLEDYSYRRQTVSPRVFDMGRPGMGSRPQSSIPYLTSRNRPSSARPSSSMSKTPLYILSDGSQRPLSRPSSASGSKFSLFYPLTPRSEQKPLFSRQRESTQPGVHQNASRDGVDAEGMARSFKNVSFNDKVAHIIDSSSEDPASAKLDPKGNVSLQCCRKALKVAGEFTLKGIFSPVSDVKKSSLLFLHDLVKYSSNEIHMELAKFGCVVKLVDFLRINDDDELFEITGLIISRMLISSDRRLCQLFNRHGGTNILMALLKKYPGTELNREACSTLNSVNNVLHQSTNSSDNAEGRPNDVWEHIMQSWEEQDEVVKVLQQFIDK